MPETAGPGHQRTHFDKPCPNWHEVFIKESEWAVPMELITDNLSEMDCLMMHQTGASKSKQETKRDSKVRRKVGGKK